MSKEMTFFEHLEELKDRLTRIFISIVIVAGACFAFGLKEVEISGTKLILPLPDPFNNIAAQVITSVGEFMKPEYVEFIMTAPAQAIIAQLYVSIFLGIVVSMPVIIKEVAAFVNPALYPHEREAITKLLIPGTVLFVGGCIFSYLWITPFIIDFLYRYGLALQAATFITLDSFISFVLLFVISFGIIFELPVFMWIITKAGVVEPSFWKRNFRYAVFAMIVFGAIITPDGSGITMWVIAAPMIVLYLGGYLIVSRAKK